MNEFIQLTAFSSLDKNLYVTRCKKWLWFTISKKCEPLFATCCLNKFFTVTPSAINRFVCTTWWKKWNCTSNKISTELHLIIHEANKTIFIVIYQAINYVKRYGYIGSQVLYDASIGVTGTFRFAFSLTSISKFPCRWIDALNINTI